MSSKAHRILHIVLICLLFSVPSQAQNRWDSHTKRELSEEKQTAVIGADSVVWHLDLNRGDYVSIEVLQLDVDLLIQVFDPDDGQMMEVDTEAEGAELARWVSRKSGVWHIIASPFEEGGSGNYEIRLKGKRKASDADIALVQTDSLHFLGLDYRDEGRREEAEELLKLVLTSYLELDGDGQLSAAQTARDIGAFVQGQGRYEEAEEYLSQSLDIYEVVLPAGDPQLAVGLNMLGFAQKLQGELLDAELNYVKALDINEAALDPYDAEIAATLDNLGVVYYRLSRFEEAEVIFKRAIDIFETSLGKEHPTTAISLNNLALLYKQLGRFQEAEKLYIRSLGIDEKSFGPNHPRLAAISYNLAAFYESQSRYDDAEPLYLKALRINEGALGLTHPNVGIVLSGLSSLYSNQGRLGESELLLKRALGIFETAFGEDHPTIYPLLSGLSYVYFGQDRLLEAEAVANRALTIFESKYGEVHSDVATLLDTMGGILLSQKRYEDALTILDRALSISQEIYGVDNEAVTKHLWKMGHVYMAQDKLEEAELKFSQSLEINEKAYGPESPKVALGLIDLASLYQKSNEDSLAIAALNRSIPIFDRTSQNPESRVLAYSIRAQSHQNIGDLDRAMDDLEEALLSAEEMRPQIGGSEQTRADFFGQYADDFDTMVAWTIASGDLEKAFEYTERGRARVLLDQLQSGKIDIRTSIPADIRAPLEKRERAAKTRLAGLQHQQNLLRSRSDISAQERQGFLEALDDSLRLADRSFSEVYAEIKNSSPLWRDMTTAGGAPITLRQANRNLVPADGLMLLYQIGSKASHVFVIGSTRNDIQAIPLLVSEEDSKNLGVDAGPLTEEAVRQLTIGSDSTRLPGVLAGLASRGTDVAGQARISTTDQLHALWKTIIPDGLWNQILDAENILLIPDGSLLGISFEALVVEPGANFESTRYWLDEGPTIRYAPSATSLFNLERRPNSRIVPNSTETLWLSLFDPIFDSAELRDELAEVVEDRVSTAGDFNGLSTSLARLPGTALEAEALIDVFDEQVEQLQGISATENELRSALPGKRYLHLATHGLVNEDRGSLFASLALTVPQETSVELESDGFLQLNEIYALALEEVELAILSACETNTGGAVAGEGVFALSRGFLTAGAKRVIASQWSVDDTSTASLMGEVFRLLDEQIDQGKRANYDEILRDAKRLVRSQSKWASPYHWAPFILTGQR